MKNSQRGIIAGVVVSVLVAVGFWLRSEPSPELGSAPTAVAPAAPQANEPKGYSARVAERLKQLREDYEDRQRSAKEEAAAPPASEAAPPAAAPAPPAPQAAVAPGARSDAEISRGTRAAWKKAAPAPAPVPAGPPHVGYWKPEKVPAPWPHPQYMDEHHDIQELEDIILNGTDADKRKQALLQLSGEEDGDALRILTMAMDDPDPEMRASVIESLGDYRDSISPELLQPAMQDKDPNVRFEALSVLASLDNPSALNSIRAALSDADEDVRDLARGILDMQKHG